MTSRPLHAVLLPAAAQAGRLLEVLAAALDGTGPAVLPVDPRLPPGRVAALLRALGPGTLETPDGTERLAPGPAPALAPGTAVVIATSGSTGEPKGAELSAAALRHSAGASLGRLGARPGERWLSCLPPSHISGLQVFVRSLLAGTEPVTVPRLGQAAAVAGAGCQYVSLVPTQVRHLLDEPGGPAALALFRGILLGGAAVPGGLLARARAAGARVVTTYGMTETCGGCVYDGWPLDGVSVRAGPDGRIQLAGPVLFSGYRGRPDLTAAAMDGPWFVTSDLGRLDGSGRLAVRGRADGMINTGGEKVAADDVVAVLAGCPGVRDVAVTGRPDAEWGELVTAVVVPADPADPPALARLRAAARGKLPDFAAPRALVLVPAIPLLRSGKPDLQALRRLAAGD
ncbi:MAG TPA: AMP-binding protein [Streptosporangiaceae bacterium]|nr:AMP-binding protein [Streptosporangiaceae bacterium]